MTQGLLIAAAITAGLGLVFAVLGVLVGGRHHRGWSRTQGRYRRVPAGRSAFRTHRVFEFVAADGATYRGYPRFNATSLGDVPVVVRYDPTDPRRCVLDGPVQGGWVFIGIGVALLVAALVLLVAAAVL